MKILFKLLFSPFVLVSGALVVLLYYLSLVLGSQLPVMVIMIYSFLTLSYIIVALAFRFIFSKIVNSISLKLVGFYISTALIPLILLAVLITVGTFFTLGLTQTIYLNKAVKYFYNKSYNINEKEAVFKTDHIQIYFDNNGKKILLDKKFYKDLQKFLGFDYAVYSVDLPFLEPGLSGMEIVENMKNDPLKFETKKVFNKVYSTKEGILLDDNKLNNFIINFSKISFPIIYSLDKPFYSDQIVFYIEFNTMDFFKNFFTSDSSFSKYNRFVLTIVGAFALALFAFQVYLFFRGVFYMGTISSSAGMLKLGANEIEKGNFDYRIDILKDKQLNTVGESFNSMAGNIKKLITQLMEKQQLEHEFQIARKIQASALSVGFHKEKSVDMAVFSEPSKEVGGDYFNFIKREDGITVLAGDVSGKGLGAAMYVSEINGLFSAMVEKDSAGLEIADALHRFFIKRGDKKVFFTATLLEFDFKLKNFHYFRLGDPPLITRDKSGNWQLHKPAGLPAGMRGVKDFNKFIKPQTFDMDKIELAFLFSDGFFEEMNSSESHVLKKLNDCYNKDSKVFYNNLIACPECQQADKNMLDDVTFAIITFG